MHHQQRVSAFQREIVAWLSPGEVYYPRTLKTVIEFLDTHWAVEVSYGEVHYIDTNDCARGVSYGALLLGEVCRSLHYQQPVAFFQRRIIE